MEAEYEDEHDAMMDSCDDMEDMGEEEVAHDAMVTDNHNSIVIISHGHCVVHVHDKRAEQVGEEA